MKRARLAAVWHVYAALVTFQAHHASWCADDYFERRQAPGRARRAWLALQLLWLYLGTRLVCAVRGHVLVDDDPGDPEVGPQPRVYCQRCGR